MFDIVLKHEKFRFRQAAMETRMDKILMIK